MRTLFNLTVKSKLIFMLLVVSLIGIAIVGYLGWRTNQETLTEAIFNQLTTVRAAKAFQIEAQFAGLYNQMSLLTENEMIVSAMVHFNRGFQEADQKFISANVEETIKLYYNRVYLPELAKTIAGEPEFETYRPLSQAAQYLQFHYIANNVSETDEDGLVDDAGDGSTYSRWHAQYHSRLHNLITKFGYSDMFLINHKTGDVVYTTKKHPDFGTNLVNGPYRESALARIVSAVQNDPDRGTIQVVDFAPYRPETGRAVAFLAGPIYNGPHFIGILAFQLPNDKIDVLMTGNQNWPNEGLGQTGETYLVGADFRMRSISRQLVEDRAEYLAILRANGTSEQTLTLIDQFNSSTLLQPVDTEAARLAITGQTDTTLTQNYLGQTVLSSYQSLNIPGLSWAILTEIDQNEAFQPVYRQQRTFLIALAILTLGLALLSLVLAHRFIRPLDLVLAGAQKLSAGELDTTIDLPASDEFGKLAEFINTIGERIRTQTALVTDKEQENVVLLNHLLPPPVAERRRQGETKIVDSVSQATVVAANLVGLAQLSTKKSLLEAAEILNALVSGFDGAATHRSMEKQYTSSSNYLFVCGLTTVRIDQAKRTVDFATDMLAVLSRVNAKYNVNLSLHIGLHSGPVMAGVVGNNMLTYKIWGETVEMARHLSAVAGPNVVVVSKAIYERLENMQAFVEYRSVHLEAFGHLPTWALSASLRMPQEQIALVQATFSRILPVAEAAATKFYNRLFELDASLRPLFKADIEAQQRKLMNTLQVVVSGLAEPEKIIPAAQQLGRTHADYGVKEEHYDLFGEALIWTLAQELGSDFTPTVKAAWLEMYTRVSSMMKIAAVEAELGEAALESLEPIATQEEEIPASVA